MPNSTHLIIAGVGPGNPELVTLESIHAAQNSDVILVPRSNINETGRAEKIITHHLKNRTLTPILFPMTQDSGRRDKIILTQLESLRPVLEGTRIFFPVIGDSTLYSTAFYLIGAMRAAFHDFDYDFIPGISAHSVASSCAKKFLAMSDEILAIIPGTASPEKISSALKHSDSAAIYKPTSIRDIRGLIDVRDYRTIIRVDHAGIPGLEEIYEGERALSDLGEYFSVILLQK